MSLTAFTDEQTKFRIPSAIIVGGPASSGKTSFVKRLLHHHKEMFLPVPEEILYCYGEYGTHVSELERQGIQTLPGLPDDETLNKLKRPFLLIIDDMMLTAEESWLNDVFTKRSHHMNFCILFITQNMFDKKLRIARQNSQYLVLMRSISSALQTRILGQQLFPGKMLEFMNVYHAATKQPFQYLLLDLHALTDSQLCLRSNIFPDETTTVFLL